ncbi:hypothetical protein CRYUN_Cryun13aG0141000 [Craigia yunnanensis]
MGRRVVCQMLRNTRVSKTSLPKSTKILANYLRSNIKFDEKVAVHITRQRMEIPTDLRNALLVVAGVLVAATFQTVFSPPGSVRQQNGNSTILINGTSINTTVSNTTANGGSPSNDAGKSVMNNGAFLLFSALNSLVLCTVISIIGLLLSGVLFGVNLFLLLTYLLLIYALSISVISPHMGITTAEVGFIFVFSIFLLFIMVLYVQGEKKIWQLRYNANKSPKEAVGDEVQERGASTTSNESVNELNDITTECDDAGEPIFENFQVSTVSLVSYLYVGKSKHIQIESTTRKRDETSNNMKDNNNVHNIEGPTSSSSFKDENKTHNKV